MENQIVHAIPRIFVSIGRSAGVRDPANCDIHPKSLARGSSPTVFQEIESCLENRTLVPEMCGEEICDTDLLNVPECVTHARFWQEYSSPNQCAKKVQKSGPNGPKHAPKMVGIQSSKQIPPGILAGNAPENHRFGTFAR